MGSESQEQLPSQLTDSPAGQKLFSPRPLLLFRQLREDAVFTFRDVLMSVSFAYFLNSTRFDLLPEP